VSRATWATFSLGLIWAAPNTNPLDYFAHGDRPWFYEYHWHGLELLAGNSYLLGGLALLAILLVLAARQSPGSGRAAAAASTGRPVSRGAAPLSPR